MNPNNVAIAVCALFCAIVQGGVMRQEDETHAMQNGRNGTKHDEVHSVDEAHDHISGAAGGAHYDEVNFYYGDRIR
ncbi:hypothetical protein niasHT_018310 [Heterodera trifolii]|uniref:Uncharacterized protein n=1 Tax=Heterodera trifolii TaxID=157864 RepID=A0ABD2LGQ5_9BILA